MFSWGLKTILFDGFSGAKWVESGSDSETAASMIETGLISCQVKLEALGLGESS